MAIKSADGICPIAPISDQLRAITKQLEQFCWNIEEAHFEGIHVTLPRKVFDALYKEQHGVAPTYSPKHEEKFPSSDQQLIFNGSMIRGFEAV